MSYSYWTKVCRFKICFHPAPTNVIMKFWCIFKKTYVMSEKKIKQGKEPSRRYTKELFSSFSVWLMFMVQPVQYLFSAKVKLLAIVSFRILGNDLRNV